MLEYTKSSALDTLDFIKRIIYFSNLVIQLVYIIYLCFRVYNQVGFLFANIILLVVTVFYLFYYISKRREFSTKEENDSKVFIKKIVKIIKRIIYLYLILIAVLQLYLNPTNNDNMLMLMTVLMIFGFMFSILLDLILVIIDKRIEIITNSVLYDVERFRKDKKIRGTILDVWMKKNDFNLNELFPNIQDEEQIKVIKRINHKQKNKAMRKRDFKALKKDK